MNDDYLWDKTGQPDPEIQRLEEILGTLRYQPRPLTLPENLPSRRRRSYFFGLAIAASLLLAMLAAGLWLRTRPAADKERPAEVVFAPTPDKQATPLAPKSHPVVPEDHEIAPQNEVVNKFKPRRPRARVAALSKREREEAREAKEQVMLALRLTSEKLSLVHRKQAPANQIKNQHRAG